ncbi:MAG: hypothetical protein R6U58_12310 [Bacteroidales bacterium]
MLTDDNIQATGTITKVEDLVNVDDNIMANTLVLESALPFPGYYGSNLPEMPAPGSIYLVTETSYEGERIMRTAKRIQNSLPQGCDISFGRAEIFTNIYPFIRARNLECFSCIPKLQESLANEGIKFMKKKKVSGEALIKLQKFFSLKRIVENIYKDNDDPWMYYFEIPEIPDWKFFKKITLFIRGNIDNYSFDAALGSLYLREITDAVRIYGIDLSKEQLQFIQSKYLYELSHPDHLS